MKHLILFTTLLFVFSCSSNPPDKCENKSPSHKLDKDGNQIAHGDEWVCHENGMWKKQAKWQDGKPIEKLLTWHNNGQKETEFIFGENGKGTGWYRSGVKRFENNISIEGKKQGKSIDWHENGKKRTESYYKDGKQEGKETNWYDNGQMKSAGSYSNGYMRNYGKGVELWSSYKQGLWKEWYENGKNKEEGTYKDDKKSGAWTEWYENGHLKSTGSYKGGEMKTGSYGGSQYWSSYEQGLWITWDKDGEKNDEIEYKDGKRHGKYKLYSNGKVIYSTKYENGYER